MTRLAYLVLVVFCIDAYLLFGQHAMNEINPTGTKYINYEGSQISQFDSGNYTLDENAIDRLPGGSGQVSASTGNLFTDIFNVIKEWLLSVPGVGFIVSALNAVPNWLKSFGLDPFFAYAISAVWHAYAFWLLIEFMVGRGD